MFYGENTSIFSWWTNVFVAKVRDNYVHYVKLTIQLLALLAECVQTIDCIQE